MGEDLLATLAAMHAHSDACAMLEDSARGLGDYQGIAHAPDGALALLTRGTPFAFAVGMSGVHYRIGTALMGTAIGTGATGSFAGPEWMQLELFRSEYPRFDLAFWCRKAYDFVRHPGPG